MTIDAMGQGHGRRLTGRHVLAILLVFFGIVGSVNFVMVRYALMTFSGEDQDNPYEAGLAFNQEITAAEAQAARHWHVDGVIKRRDDGQAELDLSVHDAAGAPIPGLVVSGRLAGPADKSLDRALTFEETRLGAFVGTVDAPTGLWDLHIEFSRDGDRVFRSRNRIQLH
jgi:nitrogen fixation protein FixH